MTRGPFADAADTQRRLHCAERVRALEATYRQVARRLDGLPVMHPGLQVQAVGFLPVAEGGHALGVLITPWFMNLVRLPLEPLPAAEDGWLAVARVGVRCIGATHFEFLGAQEAPVGLHEACSLYSPMHDFVDHGAAVATAFEVLRLLREQASIEPVAAPRRAAAAWSRQQASVGGPAGPAAAGPLPTAPAPDAHEPAVAARRGFLFGRRAATEG